MPEVQNLVVLAFAAQADRTLMRHGGPAQGTIDRLDAEIEVCEQPLPDETEWSRARERAGTLFGLAPGEVRKGATIARLAADLKECAAAARPILAGLAADLRPRMEAFGVVPDTAARLVTLRSASAFTSDLLDCTDALAMIRALTGATLQTSEAAVARALGSASGLKQYIAGVQWEAIGAACSLLDHRAAAAEAIRNRVVEALTGDEHVVPLQAALREAESRSFRLLADTRSGPQPEPPKPPAGPQPPPPAPPGEEVIDERATAPLAADQAVDALDALRRRVAAEPGARLTIGWRLTRPGRGGTNQVPLLAPTPAQIETRLDKLLQRHPDARVLGVRSPVRRHWPIFSSGAGDASGWRGVSWSLKFASAWMASNRTPRRGSSS